MTKQQIDYKSLLEKYEKGDPQVALAIREFLTLKDQYEITQKVLGILRHDALSQIANIRLLSNPKRWNRLTKEDQDKRIVLINNKAEVAYDAMGFLNITDMSRDSLDIYSENIDIAKMARMRARSIENYLNDIPLALDVKSDEDIDGTLGIYANKAVFGSIIENLLGGSLNNAEESSKAKLGVRKKKGHLEIMSETIHLRENRLRNIAGEARGLGIPFIKMAAEAYSGKIEFYNTKLIDRLYTNRTRFGMIGETKKYLDAKIFGVKLSIPMKELSEKE